MIRFVERLLTNRKTRIKFNDHLSDYYNITNRIGQGDPLSMLLYIIYNADLLEITDNKINEDALGYVDNITLIAIGNNFEETTHWVKQLMTKEDGGIQWSKEHNSRFEVTKSVIIHFTRKTSLDPDSERGRIPMERPKLRLEGQEVTELGCFKLLRGTLI